METEADKLSATLNRLFPNNEDPPMTITLDSQDKVDCWMAWQEGDREKALEIADNILEASYSRHREFTPGKEPLNHPKKYMSPQEVESIREELKQYFTLEPESGKQKLSKKAKALIARHHKPDCPCLQRL